MTGDMCLLLRVTGFYIERKISGYVRVYRKRKLNFKAMFQSIKSICDTVNYYRLYLLQSLPSVMIEVKQF